jgi:hypothetical protein
MIQYIYMSQLEHPFHGTKSTQHPPVKGGITICWRRHCCIEIIVVLVGYESGSSTSVDHDIPPIMLKLAMKTHQTQD